MKKRVSASKSAMTELFSNSTDEIKYSEVNGNRTNSRRDELKKQLFGTSIGQIPSGEAVLINTAPRVSADISGSETPSFSSMPSAANCSSVPRRADMPAESYSPSPKKAGMSAKSHSPSLRESSGRTANAAAKPRGSTVAAPCEKTQTAGKRIRQPHQSEAAKATVKAQKAQAAGETAGMRTVHHTDKGFAAPAAKENAPSSVNKKSRVKRARGLRIALFAALMTVLLAASVTAAVYLLPEDEPVPADISAGAVQELSELSELSEASLLSAEASEYLTASRYNVSFKFYESPEITCTTPEITVGKLMEKLGISVGENNRMYVSPDDTVSGDCTIAIDTLSYETAYTTESVAYETEYEDVRTIPKGTTSVKVNGKNGEKTYTYKCTLVNGVEESRELVSEEITTKPTTRVLYRGVGGTVTSQGQTYSYSYYIDVMATTYHIVGNTATGRPTSESVMAVDPRVIPLNSECVVKGSYGDFGYRIAADTGGAIKGNKIDIWLPADSAYSGGFGWRSMRVYILG